MTVMLGCVPNEKVYFDHFRAKNNILENGDQTFDCLYSDPELPCFYFYNGWCTPIILYTLSQKYIDLRNARRTLHDFPSEIV